MPNLVVKPLQATTMAGLPSLANNNQNRMCMYAVALYFILLFKFVTVQDFDLKTSQVAPQAKSIAESLRANLLGVGRGSCNLHLASCFGKGGDMVESPLTA